MTHQITIEQRLIEHKGNSIDRDNLALTKIRTQQDEITRLRTELEELRMNALVVLGQAQDANKYAEEAEAREADLREYYEANEAIAETGLIAATPEMFSRLRKARAALSEKKGGRDGCGV